MKRVVFILFGLLAFVLTPSVASAQVAFTGTLEVVVSDAQGGMLPGAVVAASAEDTVTSREAATDATGKATLAAMDPSAQYVVTVQMAGFAPSRHEAILVRSGHTATVRVRLNIAGIAETVTVTSVTPLVDTTSALKSTDVTLELTESLPTNRTYQGFLQLVPGVTPDDPDNKDFGNPASKTGLNYRDLLGESGISRDNFYYIDGINVTDGSSGLYGANLNTEIIQEQKVITGGIPAEYVGSVGLLSNVILKTGTNRFSGSANYFFQNDSLEASNDNLPDKTFSTFDAAVTVGGPIVQDRAWFFGSYRRLERDDDVVNVDTLELIRSVNETQNQGYIRGTWSPSGNDTIGFTWLNDPLTSTGSRNPNFTNARDLTSDRGGNRFNIKYSRLFGTNALLDVGWNRHNGEESNNSVIREAQNAILFARDDVRTIEDEQLGGFGQDEIDERDTQLFRGVLDYNVETHDIKGGISFQENSRFRNEEYTEGFLFWSLAPHLSGTRAGAVDMLAGDLQFQPLNVSDHGGLINTINARPDSAVFFAAYDTNRDGEISPLELAANMVFDSTAGNPDGKINYSRRAQVKDGPNDLSSEGLTFFVQDTFSYGNLVANVGLRVERWNHFATTGENIYNFPLTWAPRLSAIYDIKGDGLQKFSVYWGRYFDPIRNNMTSFAGTLTGRVIEEQVWVDAVGEFVNYRTRGGDVQQDAFFAPTTQTPYTDDFTVGYEIDLGGNKSFEFFYTNRRTRDILEDYDLALYAETVDGTTIYPGPLPDENPDSLWLGLDYFGFDANPGSNFVIATLAGGKRDGNYLEFNFRKRYSDGWQAMASYVYSDADGNTNSDSNADFQGDVLYLDPRAPNQFGTQPGLIRHNMKFAATYQLEMGLEFGGFYQWNNGLILSRTRVAARRHLPARVTLVGEQPFEFAGFVNNWLSPSSVGTVDNPSWGQLDVRIQYTAHFGQGMRTQFFVDWFNVTNNQGARKLQDVVVGQGGIAEGDPLQWVNPTRLFLGVRFMF